MDRDVIVRRALISVADKTGLEGLAGALAAAEVQIVATGGTADAVRAAGVPVEEVADVTGHPEILGGRVKTLHPRIHGGVLGRVPEDAAELARHGIAPFDLVVINLYPFAAAAARAAALPALIDEIDVGGHALLRAAAKNAARVAVLSDPAQYGAFLAELRGRGAVSAVTRRRLALAAFGCTAAYDRAIESELSRRWAASPPGELPERLAVDASRLGSGLRYGENPHQRAAFYRLPEELAGAGGLAAGRVLPGGKELSYTNLLDADAALTLVAALPRPAACVIKHAGPCGAAAAIDAAAAIEEAWACDPRSAYGSVVGLNVPLDLAAAEALVRKPFVEAVVAPAIQEAARAALRERPSWGRSVRLIEASLAAGSPLSLRSVTGGLLVQDTDGPRSPEQWDVVTRRAPTPEEETALRFAWSCVRVVLSNAIVLARGTALVGVGGGQPSRVDSVEIAVRRAGERARGAVLASDAFFPFADGLDLAHAAGVRAVVQPGGSRRDDEVVSRADTAGMAMVFTGTRQFRH